MPSDINEKISGQNRSRKVSTTSETSFGNAETTLLNFMKSEKKKIDEESRKRQMKAVKEQSQLMLKLGIDVEKLTQKERVKIIQDINKKEQVERMKELVDYKKKSIELQREYNKTILEPGSGASLKQRLVAIKEEAVGGMTKSALKLFDNLTSEFNSIMKDYAKYQIGINTRLQGTDKTFSGMSEMVKNNIGITPYVRTQTMFENLNKLTELGIVYNIEQRAFLESIAENISTTFDATNGTLLRLVRLQQSDSTAARLGLETSLTQYLNKMFEDSSYLNNNFDTVSSALLEATSQMTNSATIQFEYIVQKWLGSLSSVGLSDATVSSLAQAIGYLGSGNIAGLEGMSGMRNLLIMAASRSGNLNYADMLSEGLDGSQTNELLKSVVEYIQEIASNDNKVVQAQYANLFGITLSDMTAAKNLRDSLDDIASSTMNYAGAITELQKSMGTMGSRMSISTMMDNMWANLQYGLATNIAESPALFALWKVTDMIEGLTGGINIPFITALGTGVDLNTTVDNLMKLGIVGAGSLGLMGDLISGISNTFDIAGMLTKMNIGLQAGSTTRGEELNSKYVKLSPTGVRRSSSLSTFVGTTSGSDIQASTLAQSEKDMQQKIEQKQRETVDYTKITAEYLTNTFNPKMDAMILMMSKVASYNISTATGEQAFSDKDLSSMIFGKSTGIVVSESNKIDDRMNLISSINSNVQSIAEMLNRGISVSINTPAGSIPDGFTG